MITLALATLLAAVPDAAAKPAPPPVVAPAPEPGLVFVAMTGLEDAMTLGSAFRHAANAKTKGEMADVTVLVYGRAILSFDPDAPVSPDIRTAMADARAAGVRVVACEVALQRFGIPVDAAKAFGDTVPNAMVELAGLVKGGDAVVTY